MPDLRDIYQDPYERQIADQYTGDPRSAPSLGQEAGQMAKNMLVTGLILGGLQMIRKPAYRGLAKIATKVGDYTGISGLVSKFGGTIAKSFGGTNLSSMVKNYQNQKGSIFNKYISERSSSLKTYKEWENHWATKREQLKKVALGPNLSRSPQGLGSYLNDYSRFYKDRFKDFWKADNFKQRSTGKVLSASDQYIGKLAVEFYVADRLTGVVTGSRPEGAVHPPIWNIPALAVDYLKFSAVNAPAMFAFNNAGLGVKFGAEVMGNAMAKASKVVGAHQWGPNVAQMVAKAVPYIRSAGKGVGSAYRGLQSFNISDHFLKPGKPFEYALGAFRSSYKNSLAEYRDPSVTSGVESALLEMANSRDVVGGQHVLMRGLREQSAHPYPKFFERILGLRPNTIDENAHRMVMSGLKKKGIKDGELDWYENTLRAVEKRGIPLYDRGVYRLGAGTGRLVDLRNIDPSRVLKRTLDFGRQLVKIPGINIPLFPIFHLDRYTFNKPGIKYLSKGEYYNIGESSSANVEAAKMVRHVVPEHGGFYSGERFYDVTNTYDELTQKNVRRIARVTPGNAKYKAVAMGEHVLENNILSNLTPDKPKLLGKEEVFVKKGPLGRLLKDGLDFKNINSSESILRWVSTVFTKYFKSDSPLNMFSYIDKAFDPNTPASYDAVYKTTRRNIAMAYKYGQSVIHNNARVMEALGADATQSPKQILDLVRGMVDDKADGGSLRGERLLRLFNGDQTLKQTVSDYESYAMNNIVGRAAKNTNITAKQALLEFIAASKLIRNGGMPELEKIGSQLINEGVINKTQMSGLRVWMQRIEMDNTQFIEPGERITRDTIERVRNTLQPYAKDYEVTINKMLKPHSGYLSEEDLMGVMNGPHDAGFYSGFAAMPAGKTQVEYDLPPGSFYDKAMSMASDGWNKFGKGSLTRALVVRRFEKLFDFMGFGLDTTQYKTGASLLMNGIIGKRVLPLAATAMMYSTLDRATDVNPLFDGTIFDEGIGIAGADLAVRGRTLHAGFRDVFGLTATSKYMEGLMPGSVNSPLMRAMWGVGPMWAGATIGAALGGNAYGAGLGMLAGAGLGALQGFGLFDVTKSKDELEEIYSGREEIPVRKGRWWIMGGTNFQGGRVQYYRPNWYARMKSKYRDNPDDMGSPIEQMIYKPVPFLGFNPIGDLIDPHHYAYRHYWSQPYPNTGTAFEEFPVIGPAMAATVGRLVKPPQMMHQQELEQAMGVRDYSPVFRSASGGSTMSTGNPFESGTITKKDQMRSIATTSDIAYNIDQQIYNTTEAAGLWGFTSETLTDKMFGFKQPFEGAKVMGSASEMTSLRRQYWDLNLGDPAGFTELLRRFIPRPRQHLNVFNPLINRMPSWMPNKFHIGNAYAQIPEGELLLPGKGYESAHDVTMDYPISAEMLGFSVDDTVRQMLGLYPKNPSKYQDRGSDLERKNREALAIGSVYDAYHNMSGMHDGIVRFGRLKGVQKIKKLSEDELDSFMGPTNSDISELNWYMKQTGNSSGVIVYQNQSGEAVLTYPVKYSARKAERDMLVIQQAREKAQELQRSGLGFGTEAYSHIDRYEILGNIAPYSNEYLMEENIVRKQVEAGYPIKDRMKNVQKKRRAIATAQELYPYRFAGKVLTPDAKYNNMSLNEDIKAAGEYSLPERIIGSIWERFSHMSTPLHSKFLNYRTPREAYERGSLYGRNLKMWSDPMDHFMDSYSRGFMSKTTPFSGGIAGAIAGYITGGPGFGAAAGAGVGAVYGGIHGVYRGITGTSYIPGVIQEQRKMNRYFDTLSYQKNMLLYNLSGDDKFLEEAKGTMMGLIPGDMSPKSWGYMYRATPPQEKPYIISFVRERDPEERGKIVDLVPDEVGEILKAKWAVADRLLYNADVSKGAMAPTPSAEWLGWAPEIELDDVKMKIIERKGMDAHDFGLGWYDQQRRVNNTPWLDRVVVDMGNTTRSNVLQYNQNIVEIRRTIEIAMKQFGASGSVTVTPGVQNRVTVNSM